MLGEYAQEHNTCEPMKQVWGEQNEKTKRLQMKTGCRRVCLLLCMSLFCSWVVINSPVLLAPWLRLSPWSHQIKDIHPPSELCQNHRRHISAPNPRLAHTHRPHFWCFPGVLTWRRQRGSRHPGSSLPGWRVRSCGCEFETRRADPAPPQPETPPPRTWFRKQTQTDGLAYLPAEWWAKEWAVCFYGGELHK